MSGSSCAFMCALMCGLCAERFALGGVLEACVEHSCGKFEFVVCMYVVCYVLHVMCVVCCM